MLPLVAVTHRRFSSWVVGRRPRIVVVDRIGAPVGIGEHTLFEPDEDRAADASRESAGAARAVQADAAALHHDSSLFLVSAPMVTSAPISTASGTR
jgi:hypothetical protein